MRPRVPTAIALLLLIACCSPSWGQAAGQSVTRVYRVEPAAVATLAAELRTAFQADPSIRIAAEPETGRIVIIAPPQVQQDLEPIMRDAAGPSESSSRRIAPTGSGLSQAIPLRHYSANKLRTIILRLYNGSVPSQRSSDGTSEVFSVGRGSENGVRMTLDYTANTVQLEGAAASLQAWGRLIGVLDQARSARTSRRSSWRLPVRSLPLYSGRWRSSVNVRIVPVNGRPSGRIL